MAFSLPTFKIHRPISICRIVASIPVSRNVHPLNSMHKSQLQSDLAKDLSPGFTSHRAHLPHAATSIRPEWFQLMAIPSSQSRAAFYHSFQSRGVASIQAGALARNQIESIANLYNIPAGSRFAPIRYSNPAVWNWRQPANPKLLNPFQTAPYRLKQKQNKNTILIGRNVVDWTNQSERHPSSETCAKISRPSIVIKLINPSNHDW